MDSVQRLRQRAQAAGQLNSTPQETVATDGEAITIEPPAAEVVYVPVYNPLVVYGGGVWEHNPAHRDGVPYREPQLSNRFGAAGQPPEVRRSLRGYPAAGVGQFQPPQFHPPQGGPAPGFAQQRPPPARRPRTVPRLLFSDLHTPGQSRFRRC
jgi:hypothetical protein